MEINEILLDRLVNMKVITSNKEVTIRVYDEVCKIDKEYIVKRG